MLKICKWLGWSLMSWSGAPILILNEARNSPKECAEGSIQNKLVNEWMENRRSNTVQNQQPAHVVKPGTPSKYYLCAAGRLILFESSRPCQIISSAHGCPAPTATDGEKSHILVRYITLFLLLKFCWLLSPCCLSVTPPVVEVITVVVVVVPVAVVVAVVPLPATTCRHICHPWTWGLANRMWDIDRNNLLRCGIWWYTSKKVQNTKDIAWGFGRSKTGRWEAHIPKKCWLSGSSWSWERKKNINHHETSNGYLTLSIFNHIYP